MVKPNFFIVGAPKCGTTALFQYLSEHPHIFASDPKEPHYFATDLENMRTINTLEAYHKLFKKAGAEHFAIGEASVWYLYSAEAIANIKAFNQDAKLIAMLRNPVDLLHSMHSQNLFVRDDDEEDFETAWQLCAERKQGKHLPKHVREVKTILYDELAKLGDQIERMQSLFPKEQVKIIYFDDFSANTKKVYDEVLGFLEVPNDNRSEFEKINQNKKMHNTSLADFIQRPPEVLVKPYLKAKKVLGLDKRQVGLLESLRSANSSEVKREKLSSAMRQEVLAHYRADILKLASLTGRSLDHWLK